MVPPQATDASSDGPSLGFNSRTMLTPDDESRLIRFCQNLVNQSRARVIVQPYANSTGYWFGGGNLVVGPDGDSYLIGRYRNHGDSRTGLASGSRGLELAILRSKDRCRSFQKVISLGKAELGSRGVAVLSIEGACLRFVPEGVEVYISTEKADRQYPTELASFLKPGTGIWSIDRLRADSVESLREATVEPWLASEDPATIHVKDPFSSKPKTRPPQNCSFVVIHSTGHPRARGEPHSGKTATSVAHRYLISFRAATFGMLRCHAERASCLFHNWESLRTASCT